LLLSVSFAVESTTSSKLSRCVTCHTLSGNSIVPIWPKIAEQHFDYVIKQLMEFKKGKEGDRFDPNMFAMLQGINENELIELAEHFSKQPLEKSKGSANSLRFENGKAIYLYGDANNKVTGCVGCHGIDGTGNKLAKFPILKWQHKDYLITQMKKFKSGERSNDFNSIMRDIANSMTDEQMIAVAEYISFMD
jgi:cytochrome c553